MSNLTPVITLNVPKQLNLTHRCASCAQPIEHYQDEICLSCGLCKTHCVKQKGVCAFNPTVEK